MRKTYIDISEIARDGPGNFISRIASDNNPILVFMPNLNYGGIQSAEKLSDDFKISLLHVPITLPMMDIIKQLECAGVSISCETMKYLESEIRSVILNTLKQNEGGK